MRKNYVLRKFTLALALRYYASVPAPMAYAADPQPRPCIAKQSDHYQLAEENAWYAVNLAYYVIPSVAGTRQYVYSAISK